MTKKDMNKQLKRDIRYAYTTFSVNVDKKTYEQIRKEAFRLDMTKTELVRKAIELYFINK